MTPELSGAAAILVLALHLVVVAFNVFGMVVIPLGAWRGWPIVRVAWWRILHLAFMALVAVQALLGQACFLTIWQAALERRAESAPVEPLIQRWMEAALYWDLPPAFFAAAYTILLIYCAALWLLVPPERRKSG